MKAALYKTLNGFQNWIEGYTFEDKNILWFRRCCYSILLLKMLLIWPELTLFYEHVISQHSNLLLPHKWMFLSVFKNHYIYYWLISCFIVLYAVVSKSSQVLSILIFSISFNYFSLINGATNNGDKILNVFIFMIIFLKYGTKFGSVRHMVNNAVLLILQFYICILYLYNFQGKILQPAWRDGSCFENVWNLPYFANPTLVPGFLVNQNFHFLTAWSVLLFELAFPLFIWIKPLRKSLLIIGILFHLGISLLLSIPDFGITMIVGYILFYKFKNRNNYS